MPIDNIKETVTDSKTLGVLLLAVLVLVVAAAVWTMVLDGGSGPSFETNEQVELYCTQGCDKPLKSLNTTRVSITHTGGEALAVDRTQIVVDGNTSVHGTPDAEATYTDNDLLVTQPQPNVCASAGSDEEVLFESGNTWHALFHGGQPEPPLGSLSDDYVRGKIYADENVACSKQPFRLKIKDDKAQEFHVLEDWNLGNGADDLTGGVMKEGDKVTVVWEASSGQETETLLEYTVKQTGDEKVV